ncbi:hypothetical protein DL95DRAFT_418056 [Leptodontidium sp. 2 PMI_412]|nr:hypothetical protein DL95DRAFT_418056 [Leptodontidium sp. 2 PMI_412]
MRIPLLLFCLLVATAACLSIEVYHPLQEASVPSQSERGDLDGTTKTARTPSFPKRYVMSGIKDIEKREWNGKQNWDFKNGPLFVVIMVFSGLFAAEIGIVILYFTIKKLKPYWEKIS